jgi:hypothetical protein
MKKAFAAMAVAIGLALLVVVSRFAGVSDIAAQATRLHLRMVGESIYEFRQTTGRWPASGGELLHTSFAARLPLPVWRSDVEGPAFVIMWPREGMSPDPTQNSRRVLVYHNAGLLAAFGRKWVCWGDLRTEYVKTSELESHLAAQK